MTSDDAALHKQIPHAYTWQTLIEFTLSGEPGGERLAIDRVTAAVQELNWPASPLGQLQRALAKATRDVMERSHLDSSGAMPIIRTLIPEGEEVAQETDRGGDAPGQRHGSSSGAQQVARPPSRGWGFFLIEKAVQGPDCGDVRHIIELFLYPEGVKRGRQRG